MTQNRMMNSIRGRPRVQAGVSDNDTCVQLAKNSEEIAMDTSCEEALVPRLDCTHAASN